MIVALGYGGIVVALVSAVALAALGFRALPGGATVSKSQLRPPALGILVGAAAAFAALELALLTDDFSIRYVAEHHARATPLLFKVATAWAALEGSIVLWGLVLGVYVAVVFRQLRSGDRLGAGALAVMGVVAVFFFGLLATVANPFRGVPVVPADGPGPNPLLQNNVLMAVHPPLLYAGYVGFTVPFAFAISALVVGEPGTGWVRRTQRWSLVAWTFLTAGIVFGALWSYRVLGWGGYWAWDPVENASFLPWLTGTAYLHSAVVQARRGMLQAWSMALVIATFALTILGTFLTRSGVIASVHSFTQSAIGPALLAFLVVVLVASFGLFALRAHLVASGPRLESLASREGAFLFNNLLLALFAFTVLVGTLYPILLEAFTGDQVSVGRPFFDRMAIPLSLGLLVMMGIGPLLPYRAARPALVWQRVRLPLRLGLAAGAGAVLAGLRSPYVVLVLVLGSTILAAAARHLLVAARARRDRGWPRAFVAVVRGDPGFWAGQVSHVGVVIAAVGIAASGNLADRATVTLRPGQAVSFASYQVRYLEPFTRQTTARQQRGARLEIHRGDTAVGVLEPRLSRFPSASQPVPTPGLLTDRWGDDVYVSLARIDDDSISVSMIRYPFICLIWAGGLLAVAGGALSFAVRKRPTRRSPARPEPGSRPLATARAG